MLTVRTRIIESRPLKEVDEFFASFPEDAWERPIRGVDGPDRPARLAVFSRWREVVAHHVNLDVGYNVEDWPQTLVDRWLPSTVKGLPARAERNELLGWLLGRGPSQPTSIEPAIDSGSADSV